MPMTPFHTRFRDLAFQEMRTLIVHGHESLPNGAFGFLDFSCNEADCDCRRVLVHVIRPDTGARVWASINFGWESPAFYRRRIPGDPQSAEEMAGAGLDPLNPQRKPSQTLLGLFRQVVATDPAYVRRLQRHYQLFKSAAPHKRKGVARKRNRGASRIDDGA